MSDGNDFNERNIAEFRANHGRVGGNFEGAPLVVLHTVGARSGQPRTNIMMYQADGERYLIFASYAGADSNPAWYWNLKANPETRVEVGDDIVDVHATELEGAERDEKYALQAARYPGFADYERKTSRVIPVVALTPTGPAKPRD
jgi:deazaflavin-dependent oxidoreductase (nitroreductase family)